MIQTLWVSLGPGRRGAGTFMGGGIWGGGDWERPEMIEIEGNMGAIICLWEEEVQGGEELRQGPGFGISIINGEAWTAPGH